MEVYRDGQWGSVCGNGFGVEEGWVVCYTLGYDLLGQVFVDLEGQPPLLLDALQCSGYERSFDECGHSGWGVTNCTLDQVAGVTCLNGKRGSVCVGGGGDTICTLDRVSGVFEWYNKVMLWYYITIRMRCKRLINSIIVFSGT